MESEGEAVKEQNADSFSDLTEGMASLTPKQRSMLLVLSDLGEPATINTLTKITGLHANSVRETLSVLVDSGLVCRTRVPSESRGRPAWEYETSVPADLSVIVSEFSGFVDAVCSYLEMSDGPATQEAVHIGELWGERLIADTGADFRGPDDEEPEHPLARLRILFSSLGFGAVAGEEERIDLTLCPFARNGSAPNPLTCAMHKGMVSSLLTGLSGHRITADLEVNLPERPCVVTVTGTEKMSADTEVIS